MRYFLLILLVSILVSCDKPQEFDVWIKKGQIYDGSGNEPFIGDIGIKGEKIVYVGKELQNVKALTEIDATGKVVSPGFINMLSWSNESLLEDGRALSAIKQGVTLEILGEGESMGPFNDTLKKYTEETQSHIKYKVSWTSLGDYLQLLEKKGVSVNVGSFVGAATVRAHEVGFDNRKATPEELNNMKKLVKQAMQQGAMGVGSSLIYAPGSYADTEELIALAKVAGQYNGLYISHLRSEGNQIDRALNELITISREAEIPAEIYHLKLAGKDNWHKIDAVLNKIDSANKADLNITANMYTYTAGATGLDAAMPTWVQEGGFKDWRKRLQDKAIRKKVGEEMQVKQADWENLCLAAGPDKTLLIGFKNPKLFKYIGKTLAEVAEERNKTWYETAMDLVVEDNSRVGVVYFMMSEENIKRQLNLAYMTFGSDATSIAPEGVFLKSNVHPRAYGNFTRLIAKYVRDEKVIPLSSAIYKLTGLPSERLKIQGRGKIAMGFYADVIVFDLNQMKENSTYEKPHQLSEGVEQVFVNGKQVLKDGNHTGIFSGKFIKGPGFGMP
jgi:N-acyl-D-amino-acid deacylase